MNTIRLSTHVIKKEFARYNKKITVLNNISVDFNHGTSYAITGVSGTGKSTLLHILAGLTPPTSGTVTFNHTTISDLSPEKHAVFLQNKIGLVFQRPYLINELTVIENIALKGVLCGVPYEQALQKSCYLLQKIGLYEKANELPATLSGGQQQRIAIVRALLREPLFLLADEPTGNLDEKTGKSIVDFLCDCQKEWGMGMIISSHDPYIAEKMDSHLQLDTGSLTTIT